MLDDNNPFINLLLRYNVQFNLFYFMHNLIARIILIDLIYLLLCIIAYLHWNAKFSLIRFILYMIA